MILMWITASLKIWNWFNGKSGADKFQMNGRTYYQGLVFSGGYSGNSTNTSRICFNTENVSTFSCTMGHLDNYTRDAATVSVYLDDVLYEEFKLTSNMPLEKYTLDLNGAKNVLFIVTRNSDSAFAFADISVDDIKSARTCTIPEYTSAENFLTSGYNSTNISTYDGKSKAVTFNMNGRTYYQGIVFSGGYSGNSTNTSRVCFNTENIKRFSCTLGHLDDSTRKSAKVAVYLDDILYSPQNQEHDSYFDDKKTDWKNTLNDIIKHEYLPKNCNNCPYAEKCSHSINMISTANPSSHDVKILKKREYCSIEEAEESLMQNFAQALSNHDNKIKIIIAQTGIGKTNAYINMLKNTSESFMIVVPSHDLADEIYHRAVNAGIKNIKSAPRLPVLSDEIQQEIDHYYNIGAGEFAIQEYRELLETLDKNSYDYMAVKDYLVRIDEILKYTGHIRPVRKP